MKKPVLLKVVLIFAVLMSYGQMFAQEYATATVSAKIIIPLTATEASQLNFGRFFPGNQGGTIVVSPSGTVMTTSSVVPDASPRNPGSFFVSGEPDATFSIALPTGPATLTNSDASKTIMVDDWVTIPENGQSGIRLDGGTQTIMVGATLKVGSLDENPKGTYSGTYQITFAYN